MSDIYASNIQDNFEYSDYLEHHGIKGQKWGIRRFQNKDGSLTAEGLKRYVGDTAKKANKAIATAARKQFNPTVADMNEKIAKAKEKELINYKKQELRRIKRKNKDMKYMSDKEVQDEINSRKQRRYLEEMRKQDSAIEQGKNFALKAAKASTTPVKALGGILADTADYGLRKAGEAMVDHVIDSAKWQADKDFKREYNKKHESETDKLRAKRELEEAKSALEELKVVNSLRKSRSEVEAARIQRDLREQQLQKDILDNDKSSAKDRLKDLKNTRSNGGNSRDFQANFNIGSMARGNKGNDNNNNNNNNNNKKNKKNNKGNNRNNNNDRNRNNQNGGNNRRNNRRNNRY